MIYTCTFDTPLGILQGSAEEGALIGLHYVGQKYFPSNADSWIEKADDDLFMQLRIWLEDYFAHRIPEMRIPLAPKGTEFQQKVWLALLTIPYGTTTTYGAIAEQLGEGYKKAAHAVGGAVGHNPISLIIPCHRVLGANGSLTGYASGMDKKQWLLELEGVLPQP